MQGFTSSISYFPTEIAQFKLKCHAAAAQYALEIYRLGYYGGSGARLIASVPIATAACDQQPACEWAAETKMTDCHNWKVSVEWPIPAGTHTGVYLALPVALADRKVGGYIPFVVKQPASKQGSALLFKTSDLTWVAYNKYGGWNVYGRNHSKDFSTRAYAASYNRPFANRLTYPIGQQQNFVLGSEFAMLYWLEKYGYDVSYAACRDIETLHQQQLLGRYQVLLSVGHDEYWTKGMKQAFKAARDEGVHLAFFSGNEMFWRVIWQEDYQHTLSELKLSSVLNDKREDQRSFVCRKESIDDKPSPHTDLWTGTFGDPRHQLPDPENSLSGQLFMVNSYRNDSLTVSGEEMGLRFWRNTSFHHIHRPRAPDSYRTPAGVLGYEWDIFVDDVFRPPGLFTLSSTTMMVGYGLSENYGASYRGSGTVTHKLTLYRHHTPNTTNITSHAAMEQYCSNLHQEEKQGLSALVFGAGTIQWAWALSSFRDGDPMPVDINIQQATMNLFADMGTFPDSTLNTQGRITLWNDSHDQAVKAGQYLVYPTASTDTDPPISHLSLFGSVNATGKLRIWGTARDQGGGKVAGVEVSVDAGKSWHLATGRTRWRYHFSHLGHNPGRAHGFHGNQSAFDSVLHDISSSEYVLREQLVRQGRLYGVGSRWPSKGMVMVVMSRAVDDSGNLEKVHVSPCLCKLLGRSSGNDSSSSSSRGRAAGNVLVLGEAGNLSNNLC